MSLKVMKGRFQRLCLILKEQKFFLQVLIILQDYGMLSQVKCCKFLKVMRIKYSHVSLIMKETLLLQVQKIILAKFGEIQSHMYINPKNDSKLFHLNHSIVLEFLHEHYYFTLQHYFFSIYNFIFGYPLEFFALF